MIWTDEADALLVRLWDEGGSLSYVANGLQQAGYAVSRNAIAGRKHRLPREAFKRRTTTSLMTFKPPPKPPPPRSNNVTKMPPRTPLTVTEVDAISKTPGVEYLDNGSNGCKAILPERSGKWKLQKVCGKPRGYDYNGSMSSYCPTHFRMYTNPLAVRKQHA